MNEEDYWIPRQLDAPNLFFMWDADNAMIVIVFIFLGGMMNMFFVGIVLAIIFGRAYARLKEEGGRGLLVKILYWYTPSDWWLTKKLPSHVREFIR